MAVLTEVRDRVKAGDISIEGSKQFKEFDDYLITKEEWDKVKYNNALDINLSVDAYLNNKCTTLNERLNWVSKNTKNLDNVSLEKGKISISRLEKDTPKEAKSLSVDSYKLIPRTSLSDLISDVAKLTGFHNENNKEKYEKLNISLEQLREEMSKLRAMIGKVRGMVNEAGGGILFEDWNIENCAEIWAIRNGIMNGIKIENMVMKTWNFRLETFKKPCDNCIITIFKFVLSGRLLR